MNKDVMIINGEEWVKKSSIPETKEADNLAPYPCCGKIPLVNVGGILFLTRENAIEWWNAAVGKLRAEEPEREREPEPQILPCPLCHSPCRLVPAEGEEAGRWVVVCSSCCYDLPSCASQEAAIKLHHQMHGGFVRAMEDACRRSRDPTRIDL